MSDRGLDSGFRPSPKQIGGGVLALVAIIFVFQNTQRVSIHLLGFTIEAQLWIVLIAMMLIGAVAATLLRWHGGRRRD